MNITTNRNADGGGVAVRPRLSLPAIRAVILFCLFLVSCRPNPRDLNERALAYAREGEYGKAVELLKQVIGEVSDEPLYHANLAVVFQRANRLQEAIESQKRAAEIPGPSRSSMMKRLARLQRLAGRSVEAADTLAALYEMEPADPETAYLLGVAGSEAGRMEQSRRIVEQALGRFPDDSRLLTLQARIEMGTGNMDRAREILRGISEKGSMGIQARLLLGDLDYLSGFHASALVSYKAAARMMESPEIDLKIGLSALKVGDAETAARHLEKAASHTPYQESALLALAVLFFRNPDGLWEDHLMRAARALDRVLQINEMNVAARNLRGMVFAMRGQQRRMLDEFNISLSLSPNQRELRDLVRAYESSVPSER